MPSTADRGPLALRNTHSLPEGAAVVVVDGRGLLFIASFWDKQITVLNFDITNTNETKIPITLLDFGEFLH